ncbi:MAG: signal peptidase II [Thermoleophilaceae bacterium]|nr:signal peptidase II [Thermoleophilaceae bacterium]
MKNRIDKAFLLAIFVFLLDISTKHWAFSTINPSRPRSVFLGVQIDVTRNDGIAFSLLSGRTWLIFVLMTLAVGLLLWFYVRHHQRPGLWIATGLMLGGALGNFYDRVTLGYVRDFISLGWFPTFNLADVALTLGVLMLVFTIDQSGEEEGHSDAEV